MASNRTPQRRNNAPDAGRNGESNASRIRHRDSSSKRLADKRAHQQQRRRGSSATEESQLRRDRLNERRAATSQRQRSRTPLGNLPLWEKQVAAQAERDHRFAPAEGDDRKTMVTKFIMRNIVFIVALIIFFTSLIIAQSTFHHRSRNLENLDTRIYGLEQQVNTRKKEYNEKTEDAFSQATDGVDMSRKKSDDEVMKKLLQSALTWDGIETYLQRRKQIMSEYKFSEDDQFMTTFMPGEIQGISRKAPDGAVYYDHDANVNSKFDSLESYILSTEGSTYRYAAFATSTTRSKNGEASSKGTSFLTYEMVDGHPVNINAEAILGGRETTS